MSIRSRFQNLKAVATNGKTVRTGLFVGTLLLGFFYIWQVNLAATAGFTMRDLEGQIEDLQLEQERLNLQVAELQSVASVSQRVQILGLTEVQKIEYLTPGGGTVAINR